MDDHSIGELLRRILCFPEEIVLIDDAERQVDQRLDPECQILRQDLVKTSSHTVDSYKSLYPRRRRDQVAQGLQWGRDGRERPRESREEKERDGRPNPHQHRGLSTTSKEPPEAGKERHTQEQWQEES